MTSCFNSDESHTIIVSCLLLLSLDPVVLNILIGPKVAPPRGSCSTCTRDNTWPWVCFLYSRSLSTLAVLVKWNTKCPTPAFLLLPQAGLRMWSRTLLSVDLSNQRCLLCELSTTFTRRLCSLCVSFHCFARFIGPSIFFTLLQHWLTTMLCLTYSAISDHELRYILWNRAAARKQSLTLKFCLSLPPCVATAFLFKILQSSSSVSFEACLQTNSTYIYKYNPPWYLKSLKLVTWLANLRVSSTTARARK